MKVSQDRDIEQPGSSVTDLLLAWGTGGPGVEARLIPVVYGELHRMARQALRGEARDRSHTLQTTALVHELYLRLVDQHRVAWQHRAHFFAIAARMLRRILVDHARGLHAQKRGEGVPAITLVDTIVEEPAQNAEIAALDEALTRLEVMDPRQGRIVELRYFTGLTIEETAEALGISVATVKREWAIARAWLRRELTTS